MKGIGTLQIINPKVEIITVENTPDDPCWKKPDIGKAKQLLGWEPKIKLRDGVRFTEEDFRQRLSAPQKVWALQPHNGLGYRAILFTIEAESGLSYLLFGYFHIPFPSKISLSEIHFETASVFCSQGRCPLFGLYVWKRINKWWLVFFSFSLLQ